MFPTTYTQNFLTESKLLFIFFFFVLFNLGFHILIYFPMDQSPDIQDYLSMAKGDFDQSPVRRYRIIIPLLAGGLNYTSGWLFEFLKPWTFDGSFRLCFSFLIINTLIMCYAVLLIFKLCKTAQHGFLISLIAIIAMLTNRWTSELSGLPLVDSLYLLSMILCLFGLQTKKWNYVIASIWIGPWAKEAFIFMVPLILIFGNQQRMRFLIHLIFSGIMVFAFRFASDWFFERDFFHSLNSDFETFNSIGISLNRLFSFHGIYDIFSVTGWWILLPVLTIICYRKSFLIQLKENSFLHLTYFLVIIFQALLSTEISRMLFLFIPVFIQWIAISLKILMESNLYLLDTEKKS
jgi:hypothetical protein